MARLERERAGLEKAERRAARRSQYLKCVRLLRAPSQRFHLWPLAVMFLAPLVVGAMLLILINLLTSSYPLAFFAFLLGVVAGVGLFATMIFQPVDALLPTAIAESEAKLNLERARSKEKLERITEINQALHRLVNERRERIASGQVQRASLLQRNWKKMPGSEWEDYVVEVARTLGAVVERAKRIDDEGANLLVTFEARRIAVKTLVARDTISSAIVQKVIADTPTMNCDTCAVITSGRFTGAAQDYASRNHCTLIGREEFPDFALGKIEL
jgi:hypothetical protein